MEALFGGHMRGGGRDGLFVDHAGALLGLRDGIDFVVVMVVMDVLRRCGGGGLFVVVVLIVVFVDVLGAGDAGMLEDVFVVVRGGRLDRAFRFGPVLGRQRVGRDIDRIGRGRRGGGLGGFLLFLVLFDGRLGAGRDLERLDVVLGAAAGFGFLLGDQRLPVGDRDLVIVGMDFRKCEEALPVAAIFDERRLERGLHARHLGEIDVSLERPLGRGLEIEFLDLVTVENDDPGLLRVAGIDEHTLGHGSLRAAALAHPRVLARERGGAALLGTGAGPPPPAVLLRDRGKGLARCRSLQN